MRLGYCCINTELRKQDVFCSRTCRAARFTKERAKELAEKNCADLKTILEWNLENNIGFMRVSSDMFPFMDHPKMGWGMGDPGDPIPSALMQCQFYTDAGHRLTTHPGPYTVLSSEKKEVIFKSVKTIRMHYFMGYYLYASTQDFQNNYAINIHIGRNFSEEAGKIFCNTIQKISPEVRSQITVENDDKPNGWTVQKLKKHIYDKVGVPIVFDAHHHRFCNEGESAKEALDIALSTWPTFKKPKVHYSESRPGARPQAHSDLVKSIPSYFEGLDVMVECKKKEQSIINLRQLGLI